MTPILTGQSDRGMVSLARLAIFSSYYDGPGVAVGLQCEFIQWPEEKPVLSSRDCVAQVGLQLLGSKLQSPS